MNLFSVKLDGMLPSLSEAEIQIEHSNSNGSDVIKQIYSESAKLSKSLVILVEDVSKSFSDIEDSIVQDIIRAIHVLKNIKIPLSASYKQILKTVYEKIKDSNLDNPTYADLTALVSSVLVSIDENLFIAYHFILSSRYISSSHKSEVFPLVRRRNGQIVHWLDYKIVNAVKSAFESVKKEADPYRIRQILDKINERILSLNLDIVELETIQDIVIETLLIMGYIEVAKSYVLYRAERAKKRNYKIKSSVDSITVVEYNGRKSVYDFSDLRKRIEYAIEGLDLSLNVEEIMNFMKLGVYDGIKRSDLHKTFILNAKMLMEKDYDFTYFAGRIFLTYIYEETLGWNINHGVESLKELHVNKFSQYIKRGVKLGLLDPYLLNFDIKKLSQVIDPSYDKHFTYLGIQSLYDRYLITDKTKDRPMRIEAPQFFWMRVAMGLFINEKKQRLENVEDRVIELYDLYRRRLLCSSTPTLFNSGTPRPQLSSCYLYVVDDSIESIMQRGIADAAYLSKWAGGLGGSWTKVRGTGAKIKGTNGESNGVIPFLKMHNDMLVAVNQGGKRQGSGCAYLEVWHNDIFDFLELRRNTGDERRRTHDMNTANWIPDLFMKRVEQRSYWTLFRSNDVPDLHELYGKAFEERYLYYEKLYEEGKIWGQRIEALELWKQMLRMLFETGHPWITFKDPCNIRSPQDHVGVIHSSNLCTEITLNTSEDEIAVCNLASIVLDNHCDDNGNIDYEQLVKTIRIAVRSLDNVIDINFYPVEAARNANMRHRAIGLGMMGWHNLLFKKNIRFDSEEAVRLADELTEFIAYHAYSASSDLATERGPYSTFKGSKWDRGILPLDTIDLLESERGLPILVNREKRLDWDSLREKIKKQGMRNSNVMAIAPTATISNIMGTSPSIEPMFSNMYVKSNISGDFVVINKFMERDLKKIGLWKPEIVAKIKYYDGNLSMIDEIPKSIQEKYKTAYMIDYKWIISQAAVRQKWIDQSQSLNLFLANPDMKILSHMYKYAWHCGLKTTYYLRTLGASAIEKSTVDRFDLKSSIPTEYSGKVCSLNGNMDGEGCEACQ